MNIFLALSIYAEQVVEPLKHTLGSVNEILQLTFFYIAKLAS